MLFNSEFENDMVDTKGKILYKSRATTNVHQENLLEGVEFVNTIKLICIRLQISDSMWTNTYVLNFPVTINHYLLPSHNNFLQSLWQQRSEF